jgi:hypothetical protein
MEELTGPREWCGYNQSCVQVRDAQRAQWGWSAGKPVLSHGWPGTDPHVSYRQSTGRQSWVTDISSLHAPTIRINGSSQTVLRPVRQARALREILFRVRLRNDRQLDSKRMRLEQSVEASGFVTKETRKTGTVHVFRTLSYLGRTVRRGSGAARGPTPVWQGLPGRRYLPRIFCSQPLAVCFDY